MRRGLKLCADEDRRKRDDSVTERERERQRGREKERESFVFGEERTVWQVILWTLSLTSPIRQKLSF